MLQVFKVVSSGVVNRFSNLWCARSFIRNEMALGNKKLMLFGTNNEQLALE